MFYYYPTLRPPPRLQSGADRDPRPYDQHGCLYPQIQPHLEQRHPRHPSRERTGHGPGWHLRSHHPGGVLQADDASFTFQGIINGVTLKAQITLAGPLHYTFALAAQGASLAGLKNPAPVTLTIGGVCGEASVAAQITP